MSAEALTPYQLQQPEFFKKFPDRVRRLGKWAMEFFTGADVYRSVKRHETVTSGRTGLVTDRVQVPAELQTSPYAESWQSNRRQPGYEQRSLQVQMPDATKEPTHLTTFEGGSIIGAVKEKPMPTKAINAPGGVIRGGWQSFRESAAPLGNVIGVNNEEATRWSPPTEQSRAESTVGDHTATGESPEAEK